jgi:hypothetical protein
MTPELPCLSSLPFSEVRVGPGLSYPFLSQVSTLKEQLQQELRRSSASFSLPSGPPEK